MTSEGQPILTSDAQSDSRFNMRESIMLLGLRSILCVPLKVKEEVPGVNLCRQPFRGRNLHPGRPGIIKCNCFHWGNCDRECATVPDGSGKRPSAARAPAGARDANELSPQEIPQISGWEFGARWQPAREVAGDYYDFIPVGNERLGLVIADVTDKGAAAALFMIFTNSIVRASLHPDMPPSESIQNANRLIANKSPNAMFVSLVYALLDPGTGQVVYVNAGHNPPLFYDVRNDSLQRLTRTGMVLGIDSEMHYTQRSIEIAPGGFLLFYTDGLTDAVDSHNRPFGAERLEHILIEERHHPVSRIISRIEEELFAHSGNTTPFDDVTLLLVKRQ